MPNEPQEPKYNPQILIVEDEPSICALMELVVEKEDHWQPTTVHCGEHAIEACDKCDYDVILMDLKMKDMDGLQATRIIREHEKRSGRKRTPIIAFTALVGDEDRQKCVDAGLDDFIGKPISFQAIIDTVYKHIRKGDL